MSKRALIIEDDPDIAETVRYNLASEGFATRIAATGEEGLSLALDPHSSPSVIILDLMLPGMNGMDLCRRLRREDQTRRTPIIMLTAKASETDRIAGLDLGADDYIAKPFSVRELLARVRAVLRRADEGPAEIYDDGRLMIDFDDVRALCDQVVIKLTNKEFSLAVRTRKEARPRSYPPATARSGLGLQLLWRRAHPGRAHSTPQTKTRWLRRLHRDGRQRRLPICRLCPEFANATRIIR